MSAGQTVITYGDMTITNCLTQPGGFAQEMVFDESDTDLIYYKFTIRVTGYIHGMPSIVTVGTLPNYGSGSATQSQRSLRYIVAPRQPFMMIMGADQNLNGFILLQAQPFTNQAGPAAAAASISNITNMDVRNGPRCTHFNITKVMADNLFKIEAEFEICKVECDATGNAYNSTGVLNNRWSVMDDIDGDFRTTRTFSGTLTCATSTINANSFRAFVVPPLQPGMRRDQMRFNVTEDGLKLRYEIRDLEVWYSAPAPATRWAMEHSETGSRSNSLAFFGTVRVSLWGDRNVDHKRLIKLGIACAEAKLLTKDNKSIIMEVEIMDLTGSDENGVRIMVRGLRTPKTGVAALGLPIDVIGKPINADDLKNVVADYDSNFSRGARPGDFIGVKGPVSLLGAFAAYLQSPCSEVHDIVSAAQSTSQSSSSSGGETLVPAAQSQNGPSGPGGGAVPGLSDSPDISGSVVDEITDDMTTSYFNEAATTALYTFYQMETSYETECNRAHMPIGVSSGNAAPNLAPLGTSANPGPGQEGDQESAFTGSQNSSVVVDLAPPMTKRHVRISSERVGRFPDVPRIEDRYTDEAGIDYTLLDVIDRSIVPDRTCDAKQTFKLDREYVYAMSRAPNFDDKLTIGVNPWENTGAYTRTYDIGTVESAYPVVSISSVGDAHDVAISPIATASTD